MRIALNSLRNLAFRSATVIFILLTGLLTSRLLGPSGRGVYALVTVISGVSVAFLGGMGTTVGYHISNLRRPVPEVVANAAALALVAGTGVLGLSLVAYWLVGLAGGTPPWWLVVVGAAQPGLLVGTALTWAFLGADDHRNYNYAIIAPSFCTLVLLTVALVAFPHSTRAALVAWVLAQYAVIGWLWWRGRDAWTPAPMHTVGLASMGALVGFSFVSGLANVVSMLNYRIDFLLTDVFLGTAQSGVYSVAVLLVEGLFFISQAVGVAIWASVGAASREEAAALVARSIRYSLALMTLAGVVLFAVAGIAVPLLFGSDYAGAVAPFRWFVPGVVAWGMANLLAAFYTNQLGRPRVPLAIAALSLVISVAVCVALIPLVGLSGGAIATTASYTVAIAVELWLFRGDTGIGWRDLLLVNGADLREAVNTVAVVVARLRGGPPPTSTPAPTATNDARRDEPHGRLFRRVRRLPPPDTVALNAEPRRHGE
jgi:O-antigen/teichoic acid export membrane protein